MGGKSAKKSAASTFLICAFLLCIIGLVMLYTASIPLSQQNFGTSYYYFTHQLLYGFGAGLVLFFIARAIGYKRIRTLALPGYIASLILLVLVFVPSLSYSSGGSRNWLLIGGFSFQPSEIVKLTLIVYLALWLDKNRAKLQSISSLIPFLIIAGTPILIVGIFQQDVGTAAIIGLIAFGMYGLAGAKFRYILFLFLLGVVAATSFILINPEYKTRIPFISGDIAADEYHINQAKIAIGSGGFWGRGYGKSVQKYQYLPETIGDSIFAIIGEELGFWGPTAVLGLFLALLLSGLKIAKKVRTNYGSLVALGVVCWIGIQTLVNVTGIMDIFFFTGVPLPFISYGGTALAMELAAVGLVASVAKDK